MNLTALGSPPDGAFWQDVHTFAESFVSDTGNTDQHIHPSPAREHGAFMVLPPRYGHIYKMAQKVKEGVDSVVGAEGILYQVNVLPSKGAEGGRRGTLSRAPGNAKPLHCTSPSRGTQSLCTHTQRVSSAPLQFQPAAPRAVQPSKSHNDSASSLSPRCPRSCPRGCWRRCTRPRSRTCLSWTRTTCPAPTASCAASPPGARPYAQCIPDLLCRQSRIPCSDS